jgi:hypothetical protein
MNAVMRLCLLGIALVAAIAVGWFLKTRPKGAAPQPSAMVVGPAVPRDEPVYRGNPLRYWVIQVGKIEENQGAPEDAVAAIRAIGAKAVPFLLDWMPRPKTVHQDRGSGAPDPTGLEIAWWALGTNGQSAIPTLARIISQPMRGMDDYSAWTCGAKAISYLGPNAIGPMLTASKDADFLPPLNLARC